MDHHYIYIFIKAPPRGDVSLLSCCETRRLRRYSISITHLVALFNGHESPCVPKQNLNTRHFMLLTYTTNLSVVDDIDVSPVVFYCTLVAVTVFLILIVFSNPDC